MQQTSSSVLLYDIYISVIIILFTIVVHTDYNIENCINSVSPFCYINYKIKKHIFVLEKKLFLLSFYVI